MHLFFLIFSIDGAVWRSFIGLLVDCFWKSVPLCLVQLLLLAFIVKIVLIRWQKTDYMEGGVRVSFFFGNRGTALQPGH